jgi:hypothetical protein
MTTRLYSSTSQETTLTAALNSSATTMVVASASGLLSSITPGNTSPLETFTVVIDPDTALEEIVDVTYPSTSGNNTVTIVRGRDGSSGIAHSAGAKVRHMAIGRDFREANTHIKNETTAHGLTIANVLETTDTNMITTAMLQANAVTTAKITDANVTTAKIADSAITSAKIADLSIATGDIADLAITTGKIAAEAVTTAKIPESAITNSRIAADAVTSDKIAADAVGTSEIADGAVTSAKIANGTIANEDISNSAGIAYTKLSLGGTITSADLVDGTIVATDIANGTITAAKMVSDPYARANHTGTQTASTVSDFDTQVRTSRLDQMAAPTGSISLNSQKITSLLDPTSAQDASTKAYVDAQVNALVDGAPGTLNTLNEIATAISAGGSFESTVVLKSGSTMTGALTLSGAPTVDLHAATKAYVDTVAGSATAAAASATAAAASYDSFDDRYLGSKSSAPSVDNDGNALIEGALYWNSVDNAMYAWTGSEWGSISSTAAIFRYRYTASGGETSVSGTDANGLTLSYIPGKEQVYLNGVLLARTSDYTASNGTSITSLAALAASDIVEIITFTAFDLATSIANTLFDAKGDILVATAADTPGKITVGSNGQYLKANSATATGLEWASVDALPSQTSNSGKYLTTNGTAASWASIVTDPTPSIFMLMGA